MADFFFFFFTSAGASSKSEAEDEEGIGDLLVRVPLVFAAAFLGSTYLTLTRILLRSESGLGRDVHSESRGGVRRPFQVDLMISTMISCCSAVACTSRLTTTGRSLRSQFSERRIHVSRPTTYLLRKAASLIAMQTSRKDTSFVSV